MSRKKTDLSALESHKQLLILESELNRVQLMSDIGALNVELYALTEAAKSVGTIATSATALAAGLLNFQRRKPRETEAKSSWPRILTKGATLASNLWLTFYTHGLDAKGK